MGVKFSVGSEDALSGVIVNILELASGISLLAIIIRVQADTAAGTTTRALLTRVGSSRLIATETATGDETTTRGGTDGTEVGLVEASFREGMLAPPFRFRCIVTL